MSDRRLGIIDLSKMDRNTLCIENYTQRIDSQILALSWNEDGRKIAYGTVEGRVSIFLNKINKIEVECFFLLLRWELLIWN